MSTTITVVTLQNRYTDAPVIETFPGDKDESVSDVADWLRADSCLDDDLSEVEDDELVDYMNNHEFGGYMIEVKERAIPDGIVDAVLAAHAEPAPAPVDPDRIPTDPNRRENYLDMFRAVLNTVPTDLMLAMVDEAIAAATTTTYPEATVTVTGDVVTFSCPWDGCDGDDVYVHEAGIRWTRGEFGTDDDGPTFSASPDGGDFDTVTTACRTCDRPVDLPETVEVVWP